MTPLLRRSGELLRNCSLGLSTAVALGHEDPLLLLIQASRRLPRRLTARPARLLTGRAGAPRPAGLRTVIGHWLAGHRESATIDLSATTARSRLGRRLLAELAVELDIADLGPAPGGATAARAAWRRGDIDAAVHLAERADDATLADRYAAELETLSPRYRPVAARPLTAGRMPSRPDGLSALHLLTNSLPHTTSGYALRSHAVLRAQRRAGIRVGAVTRLGYPVSVGLLAARDRDDVDGVTYRRLLPARSPRTATARLDETVARLLPLARSFRPTVIHTTTHYPNALVAAEVARDLGVPWVYEVRGLLEQTWVASRPTPEAREEAAMSQRFALLRAREAQLAALADHVVTLSETMKADLVARGVPAAQITVIPNAVDEALLTLDTTPADARLRLGLPTDGFWVGTVSSLVDYEGIDTLIDAVALLRSRGVDVRLCVVGDGVARPALVQRAHDAGLDSVAHFPGRVPRDEAVGWHQALDVFAVPRRDVEVCRQVTPLKPMEAMALGRPVVASDLPALAEIVGRPGAGLLTTAGAPESIADALGTLAHEPELRARLSVAGREFAAGRTWCRNGTRYRAAYDGLAVAAS
ncbi:glycosyltransferase family 4 protein [Cellulomonas hominis]